MSFGLLKLDRDKETIKISLNMLSISGKCKLRTKEGYCCLPFTYRGRRYNRCARTRRGEKWCAIAPNYNKNKLWGYCRGGSRRKNEAVFFIVCAYGTLFVIISFFPTFG